jgi:hypothetical protein
MPGETEEQFEVERLDQLWLECRPSAEIAGLRPVWVSRRAYARLWGVPPITIREAIAHGLILVANDDRIDVHQADVSWGERYVRRVMAARHYETMTDLDRRIWATVGWMWRERDFIRGGLMADEGQVERQLAASVLSNQWWSAQARGGNGQPMPDHPSPRRDRRHDAKPPMLDRELAWSDQELAWGSTDEEIKRLLSPPAEK